MTNFQDLRIRGVITALVTPFDDRGRVNEDSFRRLVEFQIRAGVNGLSPCGTTGETALLTVEERKRITDLAVQTAAGRVPIFVQTGAASTDTTIELTQYAQRAGATAATVVTPFFFRLSDEAMVEHYVRVAASVPDLPLFLYNIPQLTGNNLTPSIVYAIADRCPNVVGMKDSSGLLPQIIESSWARNGNFQVAIGSDALLLPALAAGIPATVSGNANVIPELFVKLYQSYWRGDLAGAQAAQNDIHFARKQLKDGGDLSMFKAVLTHRGIPCGGVRSPLLDASKETVHQAIDALAQRGLLTTASLISEGLAS